MSVPKPPEKRRRRNKPEELRKLPAEGRQGDVPEWPLSQMLPGEAEAWEALWATPQAVAWERLGWIRVVARYCRLMVAADEVGAPVALLAEVRQLEDRLGLSPMAMLRLRWEITDSEAGEGEPVLAPVVGADRWQRIGA